MINIKNESRLKSAAKDGLLLASISVSLMLIQTWLVNVWLGNMEIKQTLPTLFNIAIWVTKLWLSLSFLYRAIKRYGESHKLFRYVEGVNYGSLVALCSSLIVAGVMHIHNFVLFKGLFHEQLESALAQFNNNPEVLDQIETILPFLPQIILWFSLIYYTLFGVIASAIIANSTKKGDSIFDKE